MRHEARKRVVLKVRRARTGVLRPKCASYLRRLVDACVLSQQALTHLLEAFLLLCSDLFGSLGLALVYSLGAFSLAANDVHHWDDNRAALGLLEQVVRH